MINDELLTVSQLRRSAHEILISIGSGVGRWSGLTLLDQSCTELSLLP
jgi:hypothetical protein